MGILVIKTGVLVGAQSGADQDGYLGYQDGDLDRGARRSVEFLDYKTRRKSKHNKLEKIYLVAIIIKTRSRRTVRPRQDLCASDLTRTEVSQYSHSDDIRETDRQQQQQFVSIKPFLPIWKSLVSIHSFIINSFYSSQALCTVRQGLQTKKKHCTVLQPDHCTTGLQTQNSISETSSKSQVLDKFGINWLYRKTKCT